MTDCKLFITNVRSPDCSFGYSYSPQIFQLIPCPACNIDQAYLLLQAGLSWHKKEPLKPNDTFPRQNNMIACP